MSHTIPIPGYLAIPKSGYTHTHFSGHTHTHTHTHLRFHAIAVAEVRGQLGFGPGGQGGSYRNFVSGFCPRSSKIQNFLQPSAAIVTFPLNGRFAAEDHSIQCLSGLTARGGG